MAKTTTSAELAAPLVAPFVQPVPTATPDNTPIPGGGSWRWDTTALTWVPNTPARALKPGEVGALSTTPTAAPATVSIPITQPAPQKA